MKDPESLIGRKALELWRMLPGFQDQSEIAIPEDKEKSERMEEDPPRALHPGAFQPWQAPISSTFQNTQEEGKQKVGIL